MTDSESRRDTGSSINETLDGWFDSFDLNDASLCLRD